LLNLLIVASSNDAAISLAEHTGGSVENFSKLMNQKAKSLGCKNTHFVNPNGLHEKNHYSTAYDLSLIARAAMKNPNFRNLVTKTYYELPATAQYKKEDRVFTTTNELLIENHSNTTDNYYYQYATGIKTGYTTPAGNCLIASSKKDDLSFIVVMLGAGTTSSKLSERYLDAHTLFDYGYANYELRKLYKKRSDCSHSRCKIWYS